MIWNNSLMEVDKVCTFVIFLFSFAILFGPMLTLNPILTSTAYGADELVERTLCVFDPSGKGA